MQLLIHARMIRQPCSNKGLASNKRYVIIWTNIRISAYIRSDDDKHWYVTTFGTNYHVTTTTTRFYHKIESCFQYVIFKMCYINQYLQLGFWIYKPAKIKTSLSTHWETKVFFNSFLKYCLRLITRALLLNIHWDLFLCATTHQGQNSCWPKSMAPYRYTSYHISIEYWKN